MQIAYSLGQFLGRFGSDGAAETDEQEDEDPDELSTPKGNHCHVIVVHGPKSVFFAGGRIEGGIAHLCIRSEEHCSADDQDGKLECAGEEGAVGLGHATDGRPSAPDA